jgi:hypothetical protein
MVEPPSEQPLPVSFAPRLCEAIPPPSPYIIRPLRRGKNSKIAGTGESHHGRPPDLGRVELWAERHNQQDTQGPKEVNGPAKRFMARITRPLTKKPKSYERQ